jgi:hypothetical protein
MGQNEDDLVPPYTLTEFIHDLDAACKKAWEEGWNDIAVVNLPCGMFPNLAEYRNPITRNVIKIRHVNMISSGMAILAVPVYPRNDSVKWI